MLNLAIVLSENAQRFPDRTAVICGMRKFSYAELETLTTIRQLLTQKLKQLDTTIPAWPIVVQGAPEIINAETVVPGGREHFEELKRALEVRRMRARPSYTELPVASVPAVATVSRVKKSTSRKPVAVKKTAQRRPAARRSVGR